MTIRHLIIAILFAGFIGFLKWNQVVVSNLERDVEMAKLALMGEFTVDSVAPGGLFHGDRYTVVKVKEFPGRDSQKMLLSEKATQWLRDNPKIDGFRNGFPIGTTPKPFRNHPNDVEFDVVVWRLEPVFTADGDVSYRAKHYATRVVTPKDHPLAQTPTTGAN